MIQKCCFSDYYVRLLCFHDGLRVLLILRYGGMAVLIHIWVGNKELSMRRTTVMIPEDLKIRAVQRVNSTGLSLGAFIRDTLERALSSDTARELDDSFLNDNAVYEGDIEVDLAQNHDLYFFYMERNHERGHPLFQRF